MKMTMKNSLHSGIIALGALLLAGTVEQARGAGAGRACDSGDAHSRATGRDLVG